MTAGAPDIVGAGDRVLVVVAHPDDETFGCGSLIAHAASLGAPVTVLCATRGEAGERADDDPRDLGAVREDELRAAGAILGVSEIVLLEYGDSGWDGPIAGGALCAAPVDEVAATIVAEVERTAATVLIVLEGDDGHRDHRHIRAATVRAAEQLGVDVAPRAFTVALANSLMRRWAEETSALDPDSVYLHDELEALGTPDTELWAFDCRGLLGIRDAAIAAHRSQASPFDHLSPELRRAFLGTTYVRPLHR